MGIAKGQASSDDMRGKFFKHNRLNLVMEIVRGRFFFGPQYKDDGCLNLVIAAKDKANPQVASEILRLGGTIQFRADEVDYIRSTVPIDQVPRLIHLDDILKIDADYDLNFYGNPLAEELDSNEGANRESPGDKTPAVNPFLPIGKIGAPQFIEQNPSFDGRGVTVATIDGGVDPLIPELGSAKNLDGRPINKFLDFTSASDPLANHDLTWVRMDTIVKAPNKKFSFENKEFSAPRAGVFKIGCLKAKDIKDVVLNTLKRLNPTTQSADFYFLWQEKTGDVWIDTDRDLDFFDEKPMTDYHVRHDLGIFGEDDPKTPIRESVAYAIQTDARTKSIRLHILSSGHATGKASLIAGSRFFNGSMAGCAPGARIFNINLSTVDQGEEIEGLLLAARNPQVDIISMTSGSHLRLNSPSLVLSTILNRIVRKYQKPIFVSAGNDGPGLNSICEPSAATGAIAVGGYSPQETWLSNYGISTERTDFVHPMSSRGPREDGGFKPDILTPMEILEVRPPLRPGSSPHGLYSLPPGYSMANGGTCAAVSVASGAAALLVSAAKQSGISYSPSVIRQAIMSSANYLDGFAPHEQGAGLFQVGKAWKFLQTSGTLEQIRSSAPVRTILSEYFNPPHQGPGIYEREQWAPGDRSERRITFIRSTGAKNPVPYQVIWKGNDGTFSSDDSLSLPLDSSVSLPVTINPQTSGVHSAILRLIDPTTSRCVYQTMNTVVAAEQFTVENGFHATCRGEIDWPGYKSFFFNIPEDTAAFKIHAAVSEGETCLRIFDPTGKEIDGFIFAELRAPYQKGGDWDRSIFRPIPGVWEAVFENADVEYSESPPIKKPRAKLIVDASVYEARLSPDRMVLTEAISGDIPINVSFKNRLADFSGKASGFLGSAYEDEIGFSSDSMPFVHEIKIPAGAGIMYVKTEPLSGSQTDVDLYLFECTGGDCILRAVRDGNTAEELIIFDNPQPGLYKIVIDPFFIPTGKATIRFIELFTHSVFGSIQSNEDDTLSFNGRETSQMFRLNIQATPLGERHLAGVIHAVSDVITGIRYKNLGYEDGKFLQGQEKNQIPLGTSVILIHQESNSRKP